MRVDVIGLGLCMLLCGCVAAVPPRPTRPAVPATRAEHVPPAPTRRVVWQPGEWREDAGSFVWVPGHYVKRLAGYHHWVRGHWSADGVWVAGHWA